MYTGNSTRQSTNKQRKMPRNMTSTNAKIHTNFKLTRSTYTISPPYRTVVMQIIIYTPHHDSRMRGSADESDIPKNTRTSLKGRPFSKYFLKIESNWQRKTKKALGKVFSLTKMSSRNNWASVIAQLFTFIFCAQLAFSTTIAEPNPPNLQFLYTAYVECNENLMTEIAGPHGIRKSIPIVGGNFTGPRLSGISLPKHPFYKYSLRAYIRVRN